MNNVVKLSNKLNHFFQHQAFFRDCLPFLSVLYPHAVHVFRFGYMLIGKYLPLKRKTSMSAGQPGVDEIYLKSPDLLLYRAMAEPFYVLKDVESICVSNYCLQNLDETSCTR